MFCQQLFNKIVCPAVSYLCRFRLLRLCVALCPSDSPPLLLCTFASEHFDLLVFVLQASDIQARTILLTWSPPSSLINGEANETAVPELCSYEILLSSTGKEGKYRSVYV